METKFGSDYEFDNYNYLHITKKALLILLFGLLAFSLIPVADLSADEADKASVTLTFKTVVEITINDVFVIEGETAVFTVSLSSPAEEEITVDYITADGTGIAGSDYSPVSGTVTFSPGQTTATISVPTLEDGIEEPDETFFVDLSNVEGPGLIADDRGVGTIVDDESNPAAIIISNDTQVEGNPEEFFVRLSNPVSDTVTVQYYTIDDTAIADEDYDPVPSTDPITVTFAPGEIEKIITIDTVEDVIAEPDETFSVILENVTGPAVILDDEGVGTILDDDESEEAGGGGAVEDEGCSPICPPSIPLVKATKTDELVKDENGNGLVDPGDTLEYKVELTKVPPSDFQALEYVDSLPPHVSFVEGSLSTSSGVGVVDAFAESQVITADFSTDSEDQRSINFPLELSFRVRVKSDLPEDIKEISTQGTVYTASSPTVVTDDPETFRFDDPTRTIIGGEDNQVVPSRSIVVEKDVLEVRNRIQSSTSEGAGGAGASGSEQSVNRFARNKLDDRFIGPGRLVNIEVTVKNNQENTLWDLRFVDYIDLHMRLQTKSARLDGEPVDVDRLDNAGLIGIDLPPIPPGESLRITYWLMAEDKLHPDLGHVGTNAYVVGEEVNSGYSDDPDTELIGDRTALLLTSHCTEENYLNKWRRWLERIQNARPSLSPVIITPGAGRVSRSSSAGSAGEKVDNGAGLDEEEQRPKLTWVVVGDNLKGSVYSQIQQAGTGGGVEQADGEVLESSYRYWPRFALLGAGEIDIEPSTNQLFIGLDIDDSVAGGAGGGTAGPGGVFVQNSPNRPVFKRLSGLGLENVEFEGIKSENICGKEYLPYIMNVALSRNISNLEKEGLFRVVRFD